MEQEKIYELQDRMENATQEERTAEVYKHFPDFKLKATYTGDSPKGANMYRVTIQNGKQKFGTTFTDSIYNTYNGTRSSDLDILYCVLMDAQTYEYYDTLEDFADNTGIDIYEERRKAERIYKACQRTYDNLINTFGSDGYEILNAITSQM